MSELGGVLLSLVNHANAVELFLAVSLGFAAIYFGLAALASLYSSRLLARGVGRTIDTRTLVRHQVRDEVLRSLLSIAIFGGYGVLTLALDARGSVHLLWHAGLARTLLDLVVLTVWNELHFYACHRLLHTKWLYRHAHLVHHRSVRPTPWSTYSFHPLEAAMLGSVMICLLLFWNVSIFAAIVYPLVSLGMNVIGHSNFALFEGSAAVRHSFHHQRVHGNYGFLAPWLDRLLGTRFSAVSARPAPAR